MQESNPLCLMFDVDPGFVSSVNMLANAYLVLRPGIVLFA